VHALAGLIALAVLATAGCGTPAAPRQAPGLDGLGEQLARVRAGATASWQVPRADWPQLVTAPYRGHYDDYAARFAPVALGPGPIATRWQYADDRGLDPAQRRERIALPVGRPGTIATIGGRDLPVVFVFDRGAWRTLGGLDSLTQAAIAAIDPACASSYASAADGACMSTAAPVAIAALAGDASALAAACHRAMALCGSVGAP